MPKAPFFTIVIPTLNEELFLPLLLKDLKQQSFSDFEVVVVDGNSEDKTCLVASQFTAHFSLRVIVSAKRNVSHQRNLGGKSAHGKWVIFMDADNRLPAFFLQGVKYQLEKKSNVDLFTCWCEPTSYGVQDRLLIQLSNVGLELYSRIKPIAPGAMIGCRRSLLKVLSFDESLKYSEDHAFVLEGVKQGFVFRIFREPRFVYSLRRFKKEGTLKILRTYAQLNLQYLLGKDILPTELRYPMNGGTGYQLVENDHSTWLIQIQHSLSRLSQTQKLRIRKILQTLEIPLDL